MSHAAELAVLESARLAELASLREYLRLVRATRRLTGKDVFARLAADELEHAAVLERLSRSLRETGTCSTEGLPRSPFADLVPRLADRDRRIRGESGLDDISALQAALDLENRAVEFYRSAAGAAAGPVALVLRRLTGMEKAHVALIQAELDSIQSDGFWFGMPEFTLESEHDRKD